MEEDTTNELDLMLKSDIACKLHIVYLHQANPAAALALLKNDTIRRKVRRFIASDSFQEMSMVWALCMDMGWKPLYDPVRHLYTIADEEES
jgi:hypothetical protein